MPLALCSLAPSSVSWQPTCAAPSLFKVSFLGLSDAWRTRFSPLSAISNFWKRDIYTGPLPSVVLSSFLSSLLSTPATTFTFDRHCTSQHPSFIQTRSRKHRSTVRSFPQDQATGPTHSLIQSSTPHQHHKTKVCFVRHTIPFRQLQAAASLHRIPYGSRC